MLNDRGDDFFFFFKIKDNFKRWSQARDADLTCCNYVIIDNYRP